MAKGSSARRREKNALKANEGNLAKAQRGKASPHMPLPNAPKAEDFKERVPRSLKRIMALKETLQKQQQQKLERQEQRRNQQQQAAGGSSGNHQQQQQHQQRQQQQQTGKPAGKGGGQARSSPPAVLQIAATGLARQEQEQGQQEGQGQSVQASKQKKRKHKAGGPDQPKQQQAEGAAAGAVGPVWEQPRKLKQRKKEYLNKKKLKKKGKLAGQLQALHEKELVRDEVKFGERVDAPLQVQLKRKHWAGKVDSTDKERCTRIFAQQMAAAQQKMQEGNKQQQQQQQQQRKKQKHAVADEGLREAVIEAYRARHGTQPREGQADLGTLKKLVGGAP